MHIKREVKLAITAIAAIVILIWGINFLKARAIFDKNNIFYSVYDQVDGLKVSSAVMYRGYSVGQVRSIEFIGERYDRILVQFSVGKNLEIPANSIAVIQNADLMGSKAINLLPGDDLQYAESGDTLQSQIQLGLMEQLNKQLEPLKKKAENVMVSLDTILMSLEEIFNENENGNIKGTLRSVGRTIENVEEASGALNRMLQEESPRIGQILSNVSSITDNLKNNNSNISKSLQNATEISDSLKAMNLNRTVRRIDAILLQIDSIALKVNRGEGTLGEMVNNDQLYYNLTTISDNLNRLLVEFRKNPKRFVNLSLFDFTSNKIKENPYGIVIAESNKPLPLNADLYKKYPDLLEIRHGGKFLYLIDTYKNLKQAEKELDNVKKAFDRSYIVKISQN